MVRMLRPYNVVGVEFDINVELHNIICVSDDSEEY